MKNTNVVKSPSKSKDQFTRKQLVVLSMVIVVLLLVVIFSIFIALPRGVGIVSSAASIFILITINYNKMWRNTPVSAKQRVIITSLLVVIGIALFLFPKESDYITQETGKSQTCKCLGFESWESFPEMGVQLSYCSGIVYSCTKSK